MATRNRTELTMVTTAREPPPEQRKRGEGWRNMNLNGQSADWWVCTQ